MRKKIMVIEDDRDIRETMVYALEDASYEAIASEDASILKSLDLHKPDLILLDKDLKVLGEYDGSGGSAGLLEKELKHIFNF